MIVQFELIDSQRKNCVPNGSADFARMYVTICIDMTVKFDLSSKIYPRSDGRFIESVLCIAERQTVKQITVSQKCHALSHHLVVSN